MQAKLAQARLDSLKSAQIKHVGLETAAFDCPVPDY